MQTTTEKRHIEATPGTCGGKPRIAGHRIRVQDVVIEHDHWGLSPEEIVAHHPGITLADVHAALAYYHDHREEIQRDIEEDRAYAEQFRKDHPDSVLTLSTSSAFTRTGQPTPESPTATRAGGPGAK